MAKKLQQPDAVTVRYDLHDLPTAQHKAGLAGLLLQIGSMRERIERGALSGELTLVEIVDEASTFVEFRFTASSVQSLFDDVYAAEKRQVWVDKKWQGDDPLDVREVPDAKTGKSKKQYQYEIVQPTGPFLARYTDDGKEIWHKLWRDMLWAIPRGKPTTRGPFYARADNKPTKDGSDAWTALVAHDKATKLGTLATVDVGGAVLLRAQAVNAEAIGFVDRADHQILLHFWQLTARVFVPELIDADGKREFVGYVLAIPEVADLQEFCRAHTHGLDELSRETRGYRPAEAVVSIAAEGSLEFMRHLMAVAERRAAKLPPSRYLASVEFFHMVKLGNNIKTASHGHVPPRDSLLALYDGLRKSARNPLMLAGRLHALLDGTPWFAGLGDDLAEREWSWFTHSTKEGHRTPPAMVDFAWEAAAQFNKLERNYEIMNEETTQQRATGKTGMVPLVAEAVDHVIYRLIDQFVVQKARARMGVPEDAPRQSEHTHRRMPARDGRAERWQELPDYQEHRRHVASSLFLALRSRNGEDFVQHFTAAVGSVAQYLPPDDYAIVAAALMRPFTQDVGEDRARTRDDVKTLTLLALSAHSRSLTAKQQANPQPGNDAGEESPS